MFNFAKVGYFDIFTKLGIDASLRKNVERIVNQMRKTHGDWVKAPTDAELNKMFPKGWEKTNPSWQSQVENSAWLKGVNTESLRRKTAPKNPFSGTARPSGTPRGGYKGPPPPGGRTQQSWNDFWRDFQRETRKAQEAHQDFKRHYRERQRAYSQARSPSWKDVGRRSQHTVYDIGRKARSAYRGDPAMTVLGLLGLAALAGGGAYAAYKSHQKNKAA